MTPDDLKIKLWLDLESMAEDWERSAAHYKSEARADDTHPNDQHAWEECWAIYSHAAEKLRAALPTILPARDARAA